MLAVRVVPDPEHDGQQAQQRQHAAGQREEEELDRRVTPLFASPDADEEEQRHERELEEQVEENNVAGDEHARACPCPTPAANGSTAIAWSLIASQLTNTATSNSRAVSAKSQRLRPSRTRLKLDVQGDAGGGEPRAIGGGAAEVNGPGRELRHQHDRPHERRQRRRQRPAAGLHPPDSRARSRPPPGRNRVTSNRVWFHRSYHNNAPIRPARPAPSPGHKTAPARLATDEASRPTPAERPAGSRCRRSSSDRSSASSHASASSGRTIKAA